jgi:hypothetical protein
MWKKDENAKLLAETIRKLPDIYRANGAQFEALAPSSLFQLMKEQTRSLMAPESQLVHINTLILTPGFDKYQPLWNRQFNNFIQSSSQTLTELSLQVEEAAVQLQDFLGALNGLVSTHADFKDRLVTLLAAHSPQLTSFSVELSLSQSLSKVMAALASDFLNLSRFSAAWVIFAHKSEEFGKSRLDALHRAAEKAWAEHSINPEPQPFLREQAHKAEEQMKVWRGWVVGYRKNQAALAQKQWEHLALIIAQLKRFYASLETSSL